MPLAPDGSGFLYSGSELDSLAEAKNYYAWVLKKFEPYLGSVVVEVGAGIGTFSEFLLTAPVVRTLHAIEPAQNTYPVLADRFSGNPRVRTLRGYLSDHYEGLAANAVVAVNVMEHIEDDENFLREARAAVVPGGSLLLFVPALPAIFGTLDTAFEHYRRYTRASLQSVIEKSGWTTHSINYMNMPGIAAWFVAGRVMKKTRIAAAEARAYDRMIVPFLSRMESLIGPPIGSNLLAIATRK